MANHVTFPSPSSSKKTPTHNSNLSPDPIPSPSPIPPHTPPPMDPAADTADLEYLLSNVGAATPTVPPVPLPSTPAVPVVPPVVGGAQPASASTNTAEPGNPKKRPLEDKKARERKRVLRNRELARVSNERRKGRIKAMENELTETRQTVSTLEESIRCLEAENKELRNLLQGKSAADPQAPAAAAAAAAAAGPSQPDVPAASDPSVVAAPSETAQQ